MSIVLGMKLELAQLRCKSLQENEISQLENVILHSKKMKSGAM